MHVVSGKSRTASGQSELGLMRLVATGDAHAQRVLAHRLAPRVQRVARRLLANRADADDSAQIALMEILRSASTYREESSIERWADRIAVRTALRHVREQRRRSWSLGSAFDADEVRVPDDAPEATHEETPRRLEEYLGQLPAARREALVLKHALGYTTEEIAELTDKPVGTVKDRLVAARKQIRRLILRELKLGTRGDDTHG
jgi:RNA polymerase sigma-70 factor (ECF subfamily)